MQQHSLVTFKGNQEVELPSEAEDAECLISTRNLIEHQEGGKSIKWAKSAISSNNGEWKCFKDVKLA